MRSLTQFGANVGPRHLHTGPSQLAQLQALTELQSNGFLGALNITVTSVHAADGKSPALDDLKMKYFIGEQE